MINIIAKHETHLLKILKISIVRYKKLSIRHNKLSSMLIQTHKIYS
ncbi:rickettsial conserved hypothetical protein [Rickettsia typhi str. Wilmington]|uniref:Uncharacterized protein n=1 Tax=Rickettsia typhi (strain ATCC VR-144 / Wilmington) TaxID=257363 RepID=Q68XE7_RICTY|nr:rickettsial conserved hypothetical protein [Rickettsia typhi str. Wilmington]